jgi:hypothetical protein
LLRVGEIYFEKYKSWISLAREVWAAFYLAENINVGNLWAIKEISLQAEARETCWLSLKYLKN